MATITINNLYTPEGYKPDKDSRPYISVQEGDLVIINSISPKKEKKTVKALICCATVPDSNQSFIDTYGNNIFLVSSKFKKLPNKQQLALLEIEISKINGRQAASAKYPFTAGFGDAVTATNVDKAIAADLDAIEKYGYRTVRVAKKKANNIIMRSERFTGRLMHKNFVKAGKANAKTDSTTAINGEYVKGVMPDAEIAKPALIKDI